MARTASTMVALGTATPKFCLPDVVSHRLVSSDDFADKQALLVMFICAHCPFVVHVQDELARIGRDYGSRDIGIVAISANDVKSHPDDAPEELAAQARHVGFTFPYLYDETQDVAHAFDAACTPDLFLFADGKLVYRGQLDDSRPGNGRPVTGNDLRSAIDAVLAGRPVAAEQVPSIGCNIKWKAQPAVGGAARR
jgi:peroxiredoxin